MPADPVGLEVDAIAIRDLGGDDWAVIRGTLALHGVVVLREQFLTRDEQISFAGRFGEIDQFDTRVPNTTATPFVPRAPGTPVITEISTTGRNGAPSARDRTDEIPWRSDGSFKKIPVKASILAAVEVTGPAGGETQFADMRAALESLSPAEQQHLEKLTAWHSAVYVKAIAGEIDVPPADDPALMPGAAHSLVMRDPVTGQGALYIGENACSVLGMDLAAGQALLAELRRSACRQPHIYGHRWRPGDVVLWDSRRMVHRTLPSGPGHRRVLRHISVAGDAPD